MAQTKKTTSKKKTPKKKVIQKAVFLEDGYVRSVKVDDMPEFPDFEFTYRPMTLYEESQLADDVLGTKTVLEAAEANVAMIAKHVTKWTLTHDGKSLDHSDADVVAKLASPLIHRIVGEIRGDGRVTEDDILMLRAAVKN